uniref:Uncharacterized protein n=1 Tax=Arion vulgaris TaxID=1028688 RepID=A0A0B7AWW0_9EUPU
MSLTFRLIGGGLSLPLVSNRLSSLPGILSNVSIIRLMNTCQRMPQRNQHQARLSPSWCDGTTLKHWNTIDRSSPFSTHKALRLYSSQTDESDSLGHLVYEGRVGKMMKALKVFSLTTSTIGLAVQPYIWISFQNMSLAAAVPLFTVLNSFVFVNPILIHYISKKYVIDLYLIMRRRYLQHMF